MTDTTPVVFISIRAATKAAEALRSEAWREVFGCEYIPRKQKIVRRIRRGAVRGYMLSTQLGILTEADWARHVNAC